MGPDAHCKHVSVAIYGLTKFSVNAAIDVQVTCTGNLQRFHQAKRFKGSPVKAHKFILTQKPATPNSIAIISSCDPRPAEYRNMKYYQNFVRNVSLNFQYLGNEMPICQLYEPANLYAVAHDHDYLKYSPEEMFLQKMNISTISGSAIEEIETNTRGQCKNRRWVRERLFRITSSNFGRICKATVVTNLDSLAKEMLKTRIVKCKSVDHSKMYESTVVSKYEEITGNHSTECGMVICKDYSFLASSPDGLVNDNIVVEVKCPYSARHSEINSSTVNYVLDGVNGLELDKKHY